MFYTKLQSEIKINTEVVKLLKFHLAFGSESIITKCLNITVWVNTV